MTRLFDAVSAELSTASRSITSTARQNGIINADEWRRMENMNPIGGRAGDAYLVQGAMIPTDTAGQPKPETDEPEPARRQEAAQVNVRVIGRGDEETRTRELEVVRDAAGNLIGAKVVEKLVTEEGAGGQ